MKQKCIIYGGAGFIGSHICEELLTKRINVTIFDKKNSSRKNISHLEKKINFIEGDFNNIVDIEDSLEDMDYAIHLVSSTLPADSNLNPMYDVETNLISSLNFLEACVRNKIKSVIFISSGGTVYGNPLKLPITESHPTNPTTSYGIIKLTIEKYFELYRTLKGLNYTILRFANPFGERQNPKLSQGLIAHLLYKIKIKEPIEIWGNGNVIRDYFYIRDGVKSIYPALTNKTKYNTFNISSSKGRSVNEILEDFRNILKLKFDVRYTLSRKFDVKSNILDNRRARKYLKWKPSTPFNTALKRTWKYILDNE